jgi:S-formylglutathione hydrolase FrmB
MKKMRSLRSVLIAVGLATVLASGCHKDAVRSLLDHPRLAPGVAMQDVTFYSAALKRNMTYRVFLPAKIVEGERLPVVYLLHGGGGDYRNWSNYSDVAQYAAHGPILVMADGGSSYFVNAALKPEDKYEDYLVNDLIPDVERRFPAAKKREGRAIVGVSMGGYAAVYFALTRPDLFVFAGGISPAIDVPSRRFTVRRLSQSQRFRTIFGPDGSDSRKRADPFLLVQSADPRVTPYIYLTAGDNEPLREPIQRFAQRLGSRHFAYEFHTRPGEHDWNEWDTQIPGCFESLLAHLPGKR